MAGHVDLSYCCADACIEGSSYCCSHVECSFPADSFLSPVTNAISRRLQSRGEWLFSIWKIKMRMQTRMRAWTNHERHKFPHWAPLSCFGGLSSAIFACSLHGFRCERRAEPPVHRQRGARRAGLPQAEERAPVRMCPIVLNETHAAC